MHSNVDSKRSSWLKVETVSPKIRTESSAVPEKQKEDLIRYCRYCGEKLSPREKICQSCGAEI